MSQTMFDFDYRGGDFQTQLKVGNNSFYGWNYIQSVTPRTALGGEIFWLGQQRKSGVGLAGRHESPAGHVATCQVATTRLLSMSYWHKVSDKVYRSKRLWCLLLDLEENLSPLEDLRNAYDRCIDLRVASAQV